MSESDKVFITIHGNTWITGLIGFAIVGGGVIFWATLILWLAFRLFSNF